MSQNRDEPRVSIIIPVYNGAKFISGAIESALGQSFPSWELIVVDDGSIDDTAKIVLTFSDKRIRYIYQSNCGQAAALNRGLDMARGEYITTLDADDWFTPNSLADRVEYLDQHPEYGAAYGDGYYCNSQGEPIATFADYRPANLQGDIYGTLIWMNLPSQGAAVLIRRTAIMQPRLRYDESIMWCQDWDLYIRLAEKTEFGYVDSILVKYRLHEGNMTMIMPSRRKMDSVSRMKFKVLKAKRFESVPTVQKEEFFYYFLANTLKGRPDEQFEVINNEQFAGLPNGSQSRLLRLVAASNLLMGLEAQVSRRWLWRAWEQTPWDFKAGMLAIAVTLSPDLAGALVSRWRKNQDATSQSPLDLLHNGKPLDSAFAR